MKTLNLNPTPTPAQRGYLVGLLRAAGREMDISTLTAQETSELIDALKAQLAPRVIVCRVCGAQDTANADAVLLCGACLADLDVARARVANERAAVLAEFDAAFAEYAAVLDASPPAVQAWWEQILAKRGRMLEDESDALIERAWQAQGRATALITAWRAWGEDNARLSARLDALRHAQAQINTAVLAAPGVLLEAA